MKGWTDKALAAVGTTGAAQERPKRTAPTPVPPAQIERRPGQILLAPDLWVPQPAYGDATQGQAQWLFDAGRVSFSLASPHGRQRISINGQPDPGLLAALLAAAEAHVSKS